MRVEPQASVLPDGERLHLHHGPIDLIIGVDGSERDACFAAATARFQTVLTGLTLELQDLRRPVSPRTQFSDVIAQRMGQAVRPYRHAFVTPMAAVAGAVADEVLSAILTRHRPRKAYVNNGGDIAFHLSDTAEFRSLGPTGEIVVTSNDAARGIATSGWRGRSHSRGIVDAVTVLAKSAAAADVAATMIANAVDRPDHPAISRAPASTLSPDSDLGDRLVTTDVGELPAADVALALSSGRALAQSLIDRGEIIDAALLLQGLVVTASHDTYSPLEGAFAHA